MVIKDAATVAEAAELLRVDPMTIYRAIGDLAFPAVEIRGRYIVPAPALEQDDRTPGRRGRDAESAPSCLPVGRA